LLATVGCGSAASRSITGNWEAQETVGINRKGETEDRTLRLDINSNGTFRIQESVGDVAKSDYKGTWKQTKETVNKVTLEFTYDGTKTPHLRDFEFPPDGATDECQMSIEGSALIMNLYRKH